MLMQTKKSIPSKSNDPDESGHVPMTLHPKEAALIYLMRHLGQGVVEQVTVKDSLPQSIQKVEQRFVLDNSDVLSRMFEKEGKFYPLGRG